MSLLVREPPSEHLTAVGLFSPHQIKQVAYWRAGRGYRAGNAMVKVEP